MFASLRIASLVCLGLGAGLLVSPRAARAQQLPGGATVEFDGPFLHVDDKEDLTRGNTETVIDYFNFAHCECARTDATFPERTFAWDLTLKNRSAAVDLPADLWVGAGCDTDDDTQRATSCRQIGTIQDLDSLVRRDRREISLFHLMQPLTTSNACPERAGDAITWVAADTTEDGKYDYFTSKKIAIDTQPPNLPSKVTVAPGEGAALMSWTNPEERQTDTKFYYFLCAAAGEPALEKPSHEAEIETPVSLCGGAQGLKFSTEDDSPVPAWLNGDIQPYVCGRASRTATSARISNLRAGVEYTVAMVAVDDALKDRKSVV
jgi:hypothetical protein